MNAKGRIKVLVIDDSALVRKVLKEWINLEDDMEVIGLAADPYVATGKLRLQKPDVITLDIEMPRMDGLTFLRKLMAQHPIPVIIISSLGKTGSEVAMKALEYGAVDVFLKDDLRLNSTNNTMQAVLTDRIRGAAQSIVRKVKPMNWNVSSVNELANVNTTDKTVVLGASTGGTTAIQEIITALPPNAPGMVIVQHMPKTFTKFFADRLNELSPLSVKEAEDGDRVLNGSVLIAPGDKHLKIMRQGASTIVRTWDGPFVNRHKPSVDVLFDSAADQLGRNAIGVLLTGMGRDGADGMLKMKNAGAVTIAQDEASSVVYGMPKEAVKLNAVDVVAPLQEISRRIIEQL